MLRAQLMQCITPGKARDPVSSSATATEAQDALSKLLCSKPTKVHTQRPSQPLGSLALPSAQQILLNGHNILLAVAVATNYEWPQISHHKAAIKSLSRAPAASSTGHACTRSSASREYDEPVTGPASALSRTPSVTHRQREEAAQIYYEGPTEGALHLDTAVTVFQQYFSGEMDAELPGLPADAADNARRVQERADREFTVALLQKDLVEAEQLMNRIEKGNNQSSEHDSLSRPKTQDHGFEVPFLDLYTARQRKSEAAIKRKRRQRELSSRKSANSNLLGGENRVDKSDRTNLKSLLSGDEADTENAGEMVAGSICKQRAVRTATAALAGNEEYLSSTAAALPATIYRRDVPEAVESDVDACLFSGEDGTSASLQPLLTGTIKTMEHVKALNGHRDAKVQEQDAHIEGLEAELARLKVLIFPTAGNQGAGLTDLSKLEARIRHPHAQEEAQRPLQDPYGMAPASRNLRPDVVGLPASSMACEAPQAAEKASDKAAGQANSQSNSKGAMKMAKGLLE